MINDSDKIREAIHDVRSFPESDVVYTQPPQAAYRSIELRHKAGPLTELFQSSRATCDPYHRLARPAREKPGLASHVTVLMPAHTHFVAKTHVIAFET
jgi:hypothetical protein